MAGPLLWGPTGPININAPAAGALQSDSLGNITSGTLSVSNGGTGTSSAFTAGSVVFSGASGIYTQNNAKLFWDNTNARLGIGTATPSTTVQIYPNINSITALNVRGDNNNGQPIQTWTDNAGVLYASIGYTANTEGGRGYLNLINPTADVTGAGIKFSTNAAANNGLFQLDGSGNMVFRNTSNGGTFFDANNASGFLRFRVGSGLTQAMNISAAGAINLSLLTASLPVKTDASKNLVSAAINLASSEVTGTLPIANGGTNNGSLAVTAGGVTYTDGTKLVNTGAGTSGQFLKSNGSSAPTWQTLPVINYIANGYADNSTTGWATYADTAGTSPVDGTGGSPSVTISTSSSSPLIGSNSFLLAKGASNLKGNGWSYNFTIDAGYQAKVLQISANYLVASGTFVAGSGPSSPSDVTVWIYDVTNAVLIQPSSISFLSNSSTISDQFNATFQTASNSTSYRLIFHVGSTSASAYTLKMDNITVSPSTYVYGTPITDWQTYTPTFTSFGTATSINFLWRRVGSNVEIRGNFVAGTTVASEGRISLPNVTSISTLPSISIAGKLTRGNTTATNIKGFDVLIEPSVSYVTFGLDEYQTALPSLSKRDGSGVCSSGETISLYATIPIQGWSSSVQTSDQTDTRIVSFSGNKSSNQSVTAATTNISYSSLKDTHGAWNGTDTYTVPVSGDYIVSITTNASGNAEIIAYVNGTTTSRMVGTANSANWLGASNIVYNLKVGDLLTFRSTASVTITGSAGQNNISISRITGPSAIAATESVSARYYVSAGASTTGGNPFNYDTKDWDSHGAVTTGATTWKFTAPIAGEYLVTGLTFIAASGTYLLYKNGSNNRAISGFVVNTTIASFSTKIKLLAGDYIDIRNQTTGTPTAAGGSTISGTNYIEINKVGNY